MNSRFVTFGVGVVWLGACSHATSGPETVSVTPSSATVLTCDTQQFSATVSGSTSMDVVWSVQSGSGTIAQTGLYSAPLSGPASTSVDVRASALEDLTARADAHFTLATAVPSSQIAVTDAETNLGDHAWAHITAAKGSRVYTVWPGPQSAKPQTMIQVSDDGGKTWSSSAAAITATLPASQGQAQMDCMAVAVDAGNPDVVYVYAFQDNETVEGDAAAQNPSGDTAFFAVSTDGAKTFRQAVMRTNKVEICGDIISPAANTVVIEAPEGGASNEAQGEYNQDAVVWLDTNQGAGFFSGTPSMRVQSYYTANGETHALDDILTDSTGTHALQIDSDGAGTSAELFTDGKGNLCLTYQGNLDANNSGLRGAYVQCSTDLGKTFSLPLAVNGTSNWASEQPVGSMSPDGHVAVLWATGDDSAGGDFLAISADKGKTFGPPITVPGFRAPSINNAVTGGAPSMYYDDANVLWFVYSPYIGNGQEWLVVDKTCDEGQSFSGIVVTNGATAATLQNLRRGTLAMTSGAPLVIAVNDTKTPTTLSAITLAP